MWVILGPFAASADWAQRKATLDTKTKTVKIRPNMTVGENNSMGRGEIDLRLRMLRYVVLLDVPVKLLFPPLLPLESPVSQRRSPVSKTTRIQTTSQKNSVVRSFVSFFKLSIVFCIL